MVSPTPNHPSELATLAPLPSSDVQKAALLLHQFDALALGEGNLTAGTNTLAAMALTIANISPPGSCLVDSADGTRIPVGMNVLVHGALSCGMVKDRVLVPCETLQNNVYGHIRQMLEKGKRREKRVTEMGAFLGKEEEKEPPTLLERLKKGAYFNESDFESELRQMLQPPPNPGADEITETPIIFAGIGSADGLAKAMSFANRGRLLIHTTLSAKAGATLLAQACEELMSGCPQRKAIGASVRGEVIATNPTGSFDGLLANGAGRGWLERLLWLCDHAVGPEIVISETSAKEPKMDRVSECFDAALEEMVARRFNFHKPLPVTFEYSVASSQADWNAFLVGYESRFPGIAGTLRPLWASLLFGLSRILQAAPVEGRLRFSATQVDAFARLLALRMVNARAIILEEERRQHLESLTTSFLLKLAEGPHSTRELMRRSNRLDSLTCREVLENLSHRGQVVCRNKQWKLASTYLPSPTLTLDA